MTRRKAILVVSFGTSHQDTLVRSIEATEKRIEEAFPDFKVYRAFTSQMILNKLKRTKKLCFNNVAEALEQLKEDKIEELLVQPTHVINGLENDRMHHELRKYRNCFQHIRVGAPLLTDTEDYKEAIDVVMKMASPLVDEQLVLMGHGSAHHANAAYLMLEYMAHFLGYEQVMVGTVEGFPSLSDVLKRLSQSGKKKVVLMPFMIVAGEHAKQDMAGDEDSWKTRLNQKGYEVRIILKGLGEYKGIQNILINHLKEATVLTSDTEHGQ